MNAAARRLALPARLLQQPLAAVRSFSSSVAPRGGDHHGPIKYDPPFQRLPMDRPLHEQNELVWNDGVAPETAIDFDVPHWSSLQGLVWWLGGLGFFASVYAFASSTSHPSNKISASRDLPESTRTTALGGYAHGKF